MPISKKDLLKGAEYFLNKTFERKLSKFDIGWLQEKMLKHSYKGKILKHKYKNKYEIFFVDPKAFIHSINELFIDEIYKFRVKNDAPYIIDCGANIGMSILYFKTNHPNSSILAFEPDENNYKLLSNNVKNWNFPNVEIFQKAICINNDSVSFNNLGELAGKIEFSQLENVNGCSTKVEAKRLKDLLDRKVDLLKIDIEGAEYEVIKDCESNLENVERFFIEYHSNYDEIFKLNEILNILVDNNFTYYIKEAGITHKWPFWEQETIYNYDVQLNIFAFKKL